MKNQSQSMILSTFHSVSKWETNILYTQDSLEPKSSKNASLLFEKNIYIVIHRQICFVLSELISVARHISFP